MRQLIMDNSGAVTRRWGQGGQYASNSKSTTRLRSSGTVKSAPPSHLPDLNRGHGGVRVGVCVGVGMLVDVEVGVLLSVGVGVLVSVRVGVLVLVGVDVLVCVGLPVAVGVLVGVGVETISEVRKRMATSSLSPAPKSYHEPLLPEQLIYVRCVSCGPSLSAEMGHS